MKIYNTMSRQIEEFIPLQANKVGMYVCGPTVYNYIHIGNARSVVAFDVILRYLEYRGFEVNYVSNFTDVDDKIIKGAKSENTSTKAFSERYIQAFYEDIDALKVKHATHNPKASEYIPQMIEFVADLIDKGFAYEADGDVYFRVAKSQDYAKLANKNLAELIDGASGRVDDESDKKESPADFALWKSVSADRSEDKYDSPWGAGRPGWHLECSVMSTDLLGDTLDIHGGGADLEFPHHTNEIAQSEAHTGHKFVNYWMHNGFVNVGGEKMSKSLGNFKTVHEMLAAGLDPQVLRFFLATTHYRRPIDFTDAALEASQNNIKKIENAYRRYQDFMQHKSGQPTIKRPQADEKVLRAADFQAQFTEQMDNDFNIANGLEVFYQFISTLNTYIDENQVDLVDENEGQFFEQVLEILGIEFSNEKEMLAEDIENLIQERQAARTARDFARADQIRDELASQGILLEDTKEGVRWHRE